MKKLILFIFVFTSILAYSAGNNVIYTTDSTSNDEETHLLMVGVSYTSNNTDNKNLLDIKMPSVIGDLYFYSKSGIWSSFAYTNYIDADYHTYETELSLGFQKYIFNEKLDIDLSYSWHQFKGDTLYAGIDYQHKIDLSTGVDIGPASFYIDHAVLFGESNNYFLDFNASLNLNIEPIFSKTDNLLFSPTIMTSFGTNDFIILDIIPRQIRRGNRVVTRNRRVLSSETRFIYQNLSFYIPIIYTINNLSLMAAWMYNIPSKQLKEFSWTNQLN